MSERAAMEELGRRIRAASREVTAPPSLRAAVALAAPPARRRVRPRIAALAAAALACALAAVLAFAPDGEVPAPAAPGVADAALVALRPPTSPAPRAGRYGRVAAWRAIGVRRDRIGGRAAVSVAYAGSGARAGYMVVDGPPLSVPRGSRQVGYEGLRASVVERDGLSIVTWRSGGRTCIVAARGVSVERLLELASQT